MPELTRTASLHFAVELASAERYAACAHRCGSIAPMAAHFEAQQESLRESFVELACVGVGWIIGRSLVGVPLAPNARAAKRVADVVRCALEDRDRIIE